MKIRTISLSSAALAAALVLAGCSDPGAGNTSKTESSPSAESSTAVFNNADVSFAMGMVGHHEQAIKMSELLLAKEGVNSEVATLAKDIKDAQGPEIDTMNSWLEAWGSDMDTKMDHGMMSKEDMDKLKAATAQEASSLFLEQMIEHHQGAVNMAKDELDLGENPDALALAQKIIDDQTAEISTMQKLLDTL